MDKLISELNECSPIGYSFMRLSDNSIEFNDRQALRLKLYRLAEEVLTKHNVLTLFKLRLESDILKWSGTARHDDDYDSPYITAQRIRALGAINDMLK